MEELSAAERLRQSVAAYKRAHAEAFVWRWRGDGEADSPGAVSSAFRSKGLAALASLDECRTALEEGEAEASAAHLARAVVDGILGEAREALSEAATKPRGSDARLGSGRSSLRTLFDAGDRQVRGLAARVLLDVAGSLESRLRDARQAADAEAAPLVRGVPPDGPTRGADLASDAKTFLLETEALSEEAARWLSRRAEVPIEQWQDLVFACGLASGDAWPREGRFRRLGGDLSPLGFGEVLRRLKVEENARLFDVRCRVVAPDVPGRVHLAPGRLEAGLLSELAAMEAVGRSLALCLTHPGLPAGLRWPVAGGVGRGLGLLLAQLLMDRGFLRQRRGLDAAHADRTARTAASLLTLEARLHAGAVISRAEEPEPARRRGDATARLSDVCGVPFPAELASLIAVTPAALGPRFVARVQGLAAAWAFREKYDEDWFRNPRAGEPIRVAAGRGASVPGSLVIEALGGKAAREGLERPVGRAAARLIEGFG